MLKIMCKNKNCAQSIITIYMPLTTYSRQCRNTVLLGCIYKWQQNALYALLHSDCSIGVYQSFAAIFQKYFQLCWHYA